MNAILIVLIILCYPSLLVFIYLAAVSADEVNPFFPYINDCLTKEWLASLNNLLLPIVDFIIILCGLVRYLQTNTVISDDSYCESLKLMPNIRRRIKYLNICTSVSINLGIVSNLVTASFRVKEQFEVNSTAEMVATFWVLSMFVSETWISFYFKPHINTELVFTLRLIFTILLFICIIFSVVFGFWAYILFEKNFEKERFKWEPNDGGYVQHAIAALFQWTFVFLLSGFIGTYITEFERIYLKEAQIIEVITVAEEKNVPKPKTTDFDTI